jgi:hypothetical protein
MSELDRVIGEAVSGQHAPFLVAMTGNAGGVTWSGAAGERSPGQSRACARPARRAGPAF